MACYKVEEIGYVTCYNLSTALSRVVGKVVYCSVKTSNSRFWVSRWLEQIQEKGSCYGQSHLRLYIIFTIQCYSLFFTVSVLVVSEYWTTE